ncbi:hypothetical protein CTI14_38185, partial [Methylobacterium radiotolerans]
MISRRNGEQLDERGQLYLRHIIDSGEHMKNLVDDLLAFSRLHTQQLAVQPVDSRRVFDTVLHRLSAVPGNEQAQITRTDLPLVLADRQQLDQLLQNLIGNSLKYRRADVLPRVHVSAEADGRMWRFAVKDNGIGIDPRYFDKIFVIFQRLHGRDVYEGTGIGLAVCKKIVERHGGRLGAGQRAGRVAGAVRDRDDRRPPVGRDERAGVPERRGGGVVHDRPRGPREGAAPRVRAESAAVHGRAAVLPDRGPVQPVRGVRGDAGRQLRAGGAGQHPRA